MEYYTTQFTIAAYPKRNSRYVLSGTPTIIPRLSKVQKVKGDWKRMLIQYSPKPNVVLFAWVWPDLCLE